MSLWELGVTERQNYHVRTGSGGGSGEVGGSLQVEGKRKGERILKRMAVDKWMGEGEAR